MILTLRAIALNTYAVNMTRALTDKLGTDSATPFHPATRFGSLFCDLPATLTLSVLRSMPQSADVEELAFTIFTGDIASHDGDDIRPSLSHVSYEEEVTYYVLKQFWGVLTPRYATMGNYETLPKVFAPQHMLNSD